MTPSEARRRLWGQARDQDECFAWPTGLSPRMRRHLSQTRTVRLTYEEVRGAPEWSALNASQLDAFARLVGVTEVGRFLRRTLDGESLRTAVAAIGESAVELLLATPEHLLPVVSSGWPISDVKAMQRRGGEILVGALAYLPRTSRRLAQRLGCQGANMSAAEADIIVSLAQSLQFQLAARE